MFDRVLTILKEKNIPENCFLMQFAVYRNYNSNENELLEVSSWEANPINLKNFLLPITAKAGNPSAANEAIEITLLHANQENEKVGIN